MLKACEKVMEKLFKDWLKLRGFSTLTTTTPQTPQKLSGFFHRFPMVLVSLNHHRQAGFKQTNYPLGGSFTHFLPQPTNEINYLIKEY